MGFRPPRMKVRRGCPPRVLSPLTWATRRCGTLLFPRRRRGQRRSFPRRRAGRRILCFFLFLFRSWLKGQPTFSKKEQFHFPPGSQVRGLTVCNALLASGQESAVGGRSASPRASSQSPQGLREFCEDGSEHSAFCTIQPYSPSLHHCGYVGCSFGATWLALPSPSRWLIRTIRLGYAIQFTRWPPKFSGVLKTSVAVRGAPVLHEEITVLLAKDAIEPVPPAEMKQGFYSPYFIVPKKGSGLRPILVLRVLSLDLRGPVQAPVQDVDAESHYQMHPALGLVCSDRPEGRLLSCLDPSSTQTVPTFCIRGSGMAGQAPPLRALPDPPCLHEGGRGRLCPVTGSGHHDPQLSRRLAHFGPVAKAVVRSQGCGAPAPQPVGASGQLGKEQALPCAENLFSRCGVRLCMTARLTDERAQSVLDFLQRQDGGSAETVSEAPGSYGIRSHAARVASCETALVALTSPKMGMALQYTSCDIIHVVALSAPERTLLFYGLGCP